MYCFALKIKKPPKFPNKVGIKSRFSCSLFFLLTTRSWKLDLKSQRFFPPQSTILGGLGSEIDTFTFLLTSRSSLPQRWHEPDETAQNIAQLRSALSSFVIVLLITGYFSPFPAIPKCAICAQPPEIAIEKGLNHLTCHVTLIIMAAHSDLVFCTSVCGIVFYILIYRNYTMHS